ncbi:MAG: diacylglycerol kinase [Prochlorococcus sp. SP3034]|nr:diacylglycerol kinase [Prochlorococcus sp. SP3034]|tara:strand:+ start:29 stop:448 length:420 start_codon:yes stop_codon:yes gene_type:complete
MQKRNIYLKKRNNAFKVSKNLLLSFKYAFKGIYYCFQYTRNFRIQIFFSIAIFLLALIFNLRFFEYLILCSTIISVLVLEILNTSLESLVDLIVENKFSKLAEISKDCSAAAVLLAAINSIFVACYIFIPKIKLLIQNL